MSESVRELAQASEVSDSPRRWGWGTRSAVVLCTSWLGFVVLHRLVSGRTHWWGPFDVLPPLVFAVLPLALLAVAQLARPVRWRLTLAPTLALLIGFGVSGINPAALWYSPPAAPAGAITVVSWNTMYWDQDLISRGERTTEEFYGFLRGLDADVYLLQEYAHTDFSIPDVFAQPQVIDHLPRLRAAFPEYEPVIVGRMITLSRLPVVGHRPLESTPWLPEEFKEVPAAQRGHPAFFNVQTQRTDIRVAGQVLSFYNSHLYQPPTRMLTLQGEPNQSAPEVDRFNHSMRVASLEAIRQDMAGNDNPVIFAGDMNTSPAMGIWRMLPHRLVDHTRALSSLYPTTWSEGGPSEERSWGASLWRLDWLFTTADVAVHRYDLLDPAGLSDHRVQQVVLSVAGDPPGG